MSAGEAHIIQPRIAQFFTNGERLRRRFSLLVLFVFIRSIRGLGTAVQDGRRAAFDHRGGSGARRDGNEAAWWRAIQSWVKPEVDPPRVCARQRASLFREGHRPRMTHSSAALPARSAARGEKRRRCCKCRGIRLRHLHQPLKKQRRCRASRESGASSSHAPNFSREAALS
jgi:hypothetical protein